MPLYGYCEELEINYGINVSEQTLMRWFKKIGPYKGSLKKTSTRPTGRNTYRVCILLEKYLHFVSNIVDKRRLVFADEKPMKEIMIFSKVRNDVLTNETPVNIVPLTSQNRFNILCAVNLKGGNICSAPSHHPLILLLHLERDFVQPLFSSNSHPCLVYLLLR